MTIKRLLVVFALLLGGMGSIAFLPQHLNYQPVGTNLSLPEYLGEWWGHDMEVTEKEHSTLGYETEFARKVYQNASGGQILTSIVLAGHDMTTSIHRPERCLTAQGWAVGDGSRRVIAVPGLGALRATRLINTRKIIHDNQVTEVRGICYYWFIGCNELAAAHWERMLIDSRDRLVHGYAQRWGMVLISSEITKDHDKFGRDERETDAMLQDFIKQVGPKIVKDELKQG